MKRRWLIFILGLLTSAGFLWFALGDLHLGQIQTALRGVAVYFISVWFQAGAAILIMRLCIQRGVPRM